MYLQSSWSLQTANIVAVQHNDRTIDESIALGNHILNISGDNITEIVEQIDKALGTLIASREDTRTNSVHDLFQTRRKNSQLVGKLTLNIGNQLQTANRSQVGFDGQVVFVAALNVVFKSFTEVLNNSITLFQRKHNFY